MQLLLALLIAVVVFCGYLIADAMVADKRRRNSLRARIAPDGTMRNDSPEEKSVGLSGDPSPQGRMMLGLLRNLGVNVDEAISKLEPRFNQGGFTSPDAPIFYLFFQRILSLFLFIMGLLMLMNNAQGTNHLLISFVGVLVLIIALFGPYLYLQNKIDNRKKILQRGFPDTLDLLLICVESGLALDASLNRVCAELQRAFPEITAELNRTRLELALINDRVRALMNLGERTNMVAFKSLTAALIQSERFGTSLTDTLRVLSEDYRLQRLTDAEARAARLPVLLTIPLIFLLMPAFILIVLGPAIINFMHDGKELTGK
ncbi:MAG: type II secretion system F family protein [Rickettsiales bacterium]